MSVTAVEQNNLPPTLPPRQQAVLNAINAWIAAHLYPPTLRELAGALDCSSVTVHEHIGALASKGMVQRTAGKARSLIITETGMFHVEHNEAERMIA